jgi:MFS family permease
VFAVGGAPALLVALIRYGVHEPKRWLGKRGAFDSFRLIFSPLYRRRTLINTTLLLCSMVGLWAGSVYVPSSVRTLAGAAGWNALDANRLASRAMMLLSSGTILGCLLLPWIADRYGRRGALASFFSLMFLSISIGFGYLFYTNLWGFITCLFFLGVGGANFSVYTLWLPEQYTTDCRGSAFAFATSFGRFFAAAITFLVGAGVARMHTIGTPISFTSIAFLVGLALLPYAVETRGKPLPA